MLVLSHGGILSSHVMGQQLTHSAPIRMSDQIGDEDVLDLCCILLIPDADFS